MRVRSSSWNGTARIVGVAIAIAASVGGCATVGNTWDDAGDTAVVHDGGRMDTGVLDTGSPPDVNTRDTGIDTRPACTPTLPLGSHENTDALCSDGIDNDCNGQIDCADSFCGPSTPSVTVCGNSDAGTEAGTDAGTTRTDACVRTIPVGSHEDTDSLCSDGIDNDCNGFADCVDFSCSRSTTVTLCHDGGAAADVVTMTDTGTPTDVPAADTSTGVDAAGCSPTLVVNEVQTAGTGGAGDEFVEIYNASDCAASLTGWTIRYASAAGTTSAVHWTGAAADTILPRGFVVIAGGAYSGGTSIGLLSGGTTGALSGTAGGIGLFAPGGTRIDSVGYGTTATNSLVEGMPAAAPPSAQSTQRNPDGTDTNNNLSDFHVASSTPGTANH